MRAKDAATASLGIVALGVAIFALGGAPRWAQAVVAILVGAALATQLTSRRGLDRLSPLIALPLAACALCVLQLIPLPQAVLEHLQPVGSVLREEGAQLVEIRPWPSLSLDPPATLRAIAFFAILAGVAALSLRAAVSERGRYRLLATVALACTAVALTAGIHRLLGATSLYGVYSPEAHPSLLGPLLNENHLGCLLALGTIVSLGLGQYRRQRSLLRAMWFLASATCGIACVATQSRGASLALVAGGAVMLGLRLGQRIAGTERRRATALTTSLPLTVVALSTLVLVIYANAGGVADQLSRTSLQEVHQPKSKFAAWRSAGVLLRESKYTGIGRGALEPTFTRVHGASAYATFTHVENEYVQAFVDWGLIGGLLLAGIAVWCFWASARRWRDGPLAAGALGGLAMVVIQSSVDFGIEMLGVAIPATIVAATLTYVPLREKTERPLFVRRVLRGGHVALLGLLAFALVSSTTRTVAEDHKLIQSSPSLPTIKASLQRHPLDYFGYAIAAQESLRSNNPRGIELLNHALALHPKHPGLHLLAARLLRQTGHPDQAAVEYGWAVRGTLEPRAVIAEIVEVFPTDLAVSAIPTDGRYDEIVNILGDLKRYEVAMAWLDKVLERSASSRACDLLYMMSMDLKDLTQIAMANSRCRGFEPGRDIRMRIAQLQVRGGRFDDAIATLQDVETWEGRIDEKVTAWLLVCDAHAAMHRWDEARRCIRRLEGLGYGGEDTTKRLEQYRNAQADADQHAPDAPDAPDAHL